MMMITSLLRRTTGNNNHNYNIHDNDERRPSQQPPQHSDPYYRGFPSRGDGSTTDMRTVASSTRDDDVDVDDYNVVMNSQNLPGIMFRIHLQYYPQWGLWNKIHKTLQSHGVEVLKHCTYSSSLFQNQNNSQWQYSDIQARIVDTLKNETQQQEREESKISESLQQVLFEAISQHDAIVTVIPLPQQRHERAQEATSWLSRDDIPAQIVVADGQQTFPIWLSSQALEELKLQRKETQHVHDCHGIPLDRRGGYDDDDVEEEEDDCDSTSHGRYLKGLVRRSSANKQNTHTHRRF